MEQRISLITLGVADVDRSRSFYEALGWRGQQVQGTVFYQAGGQAVVLWGRAELAADAGIEDPPVAGATGGTGGTGGFGGVALAHNVRSAEEVDALVETARRAGATVTREPAPTFYGGYAAYFRDPDGHVWEVAHNPGFPLGPDGSLTVPDLSGAG